MIKLFKLQQITAMKLKCLAIETKALNDAKLKGYVKEITACEIEIKQLHYDAMHPQEVLDSVQHLCIHSYNNIIQKPETSNNKLA